MNKAQYGRLEPFLYRKSARQRIILYLMAKGVCPEILAKLTVGELREIDLQMDMQVYRDVILDKRKASQVAFFYPNGEALPVSTFNKLLRTSTNKIMGYPMSQDAFITFIRTPTKKG